MVFRLHLLPPEVLQQYIFNRFVLELHETMGDVTMWDVGQTVNPQSVMKHPKGFQIHKCEGDIRTERHPATAIAMYEYCRQFPDG